MRHIQSANECYRVIVLIPLKGRDVMRMLMCNHNEFPTVAHAKALRGKPNDSNPTNFNDAPTVEKWNTEMELCRQAVVYIAFPQGIDTASEAHLPQLNWFSLPDSFGQYSGNNDGFAQIHKNSSFHISLFELDLCSHFKADNGNITKDRVEHKGSRPGTWRSRYPFPFIA